MVLLLNANLVPWCLRKPDGLLVLYPPARVPAAGPPSAPLQLKDTRSLPALALALELGLRADNFVHGTKAVQNCPCPQEGEIHADMAPSRFGR